MRGRTNVMQRKEPTINGAVQNFIVGNGNTIIKGDFVSIIRNNEYRTLSDLQLAIVYKKEYDIVNKKSVLVVKTNPDSVFGTYYAMILQKTVNGVEIIDQIALENVQTSKYFDFNVHNNTLYFLNNVGTSSQSFGVVYSYKIINNEFVVQSAISLPNMPTDSIYGISVFGSNQDIAIIHGTSGYFRVYSKNNNDEYVYTLLDVASITNFSYDNKVFFTISGVDCTVVVGRSKPSSSSEEYHIVKFYNYSAANATIDRIEINLNANFYYNYDAQLVGDKFYFVVGVRHSSTSGAGPYYYKPKVGIVDISSNNLILKYNNEFSNVNGSWNQYWIDYGDENNVLIQSFSVHTTSMYGNPMSEFIVLNEDNQGVFNAIIAEYQDLLISQMGMIGFMSEEEIKTVVFTVDNKSSTLNVPSIGVVEYTLVIVGNEILIGQPTNYVKTYDSKSAIGFAKTGGNAGDVIQVYVPPTQQSS